MKIGVLVVHGMGVQGAGFSAPMTKKLLSVLQKHNINTDEIAVEEGYWADLLNTHEKDLFDNLGKHGAPLGNGGVQWARKILINNFADAVAYRRTPDNLNMYNKIHQRIHDKLSVLRQKIGGDKPLVVIAHSLGSVIISDYIWDYKKDKGIVADSPIFQRMDTLTGFVTFGSNIPLFSLALEKVECIPFPVENLSPALKSVAKWINIYDKDDVLGYPLKGLSEDYNLAVYADIQINAGSLFSSWNPASHTAYWTDDDFIKPVASLIQEIFNKA